MICVLPEYQRKGIGSSLLESFIQDSSAKQQEATLGVFRINIDARRLYERADFEVYGETATHYEMKKKA